MLLRRGGGGGGRGSGRGSGRGAGAGGPADRVAHHPALVGRQRDATLADGDVERPLRDLACLAEERDLDAAIVGLGELARDLLCDRGVLLAAADELGERLLEGLEIDLRCAGAVGGGAR